MLLREKSRVHTLLRLLSLLPALGTSAFAGTPEPFVAGNAAARPQTIERVVRMAVAEVLNGEFSGVGLSFQTPPVEQGIVIPTPTGTLKDIFAVLGIGNTVNIALSPIQARFVLPESALKIDIQKLQPNQFKVTAKWAVTKLTATSNRLAVRVPKGAFDQAFEIISSPLQIGLKPGSKPVTIELGLLTDLTENGTKIHLTSLTTNINSAKNKPDFFIKLGKLTVGGSPLELEIMSNGQRLIADEATIRAQFQQLEPGVVQTIRERLKSVIQDQFSRIAHEIEGEAPIKFTINSDTILNKVGDQMGDQSGVKRLFEGMSLDLILSYLQYVNTSQLFTAQVASNICFDSKCLQNIVKTSSINTDDLKGIATTDDVGIIIYESWFQNFLHSPAFQKRILEFYNRNKSPGVSLGSSGVRVHLNPVKNAIDLVLNLEIDIKKTATSEDGFGKRMKNRFGDLWEAWFGSGKIVKVPVEISFLLTTSKNVVTGGTELILMPQRPLKNNKFPNTYRYPSNVDDMTSMVKGPLLDDVDSGICDTAAQKAADKKKKVDRVKPALCEGIGMIRIPLDTVDIKGYQFKPKKVVISPNKGLLMTAEMK